MMLFRRHLFQEKVPLAADLTTVGTLNARAGVLECNRILAHILIIPYNGAGRKSKKAAGSSDLMSTFRYL
jgi:hypothetical protein